MRDLHTTSSKALKMFIYVIGRMNCPVKNGKKKKLRAFLIPSYIPNLSSQHLQTMQLPNNLAEYKNQTHTHSNRSQPLLSCQHLHNLPRPRDTKLDKAHGVQAHTELQQGVNKGSNNEQKKCCPQEMDRWAA